ncbi:UDP-glucose 4-epimerase [[Bacillus] sp. KCTC 13219]|nr:UDP-glucose 4-epimerase [[Bacillus] sp. KCTC 13219]
MTILITGGLGYIGSHTVVSLLQQHENILIIDRNDKKEVLLKLQQLSGKKINFQQVDLLNKGALQKVFEENQITSVIHFAASKSLSQSLKEPLKYYTNNVVGSLNLLEIMQQFNVKKLVFSSSAIVYGNSLNVPLTEQERLLVNNPYAQTKLMMEQILRDLTQADEEWHILALRYFNPIGAHPSGLIGEHISNHNSNLMPHLVAVAAKEQERLLVYGDQYDTHDGTCIRDFIHVMDLAEGHVKALQYVDEHRGFDVINLGTGKGVSVLDLVHTFMHVTNTVVPYSIVEPRQADIVKSYASVEKAKEKLGWTAKYALEDMCRDAWKWKVSEMK